jgi:hypothetical protein
MKSNKLGQPTSAEVSNISINGFWLLIADRERFLPFEDFPWFKEARIRELMNVELQSPNHLYWPDLDVDLSVESIDHPERFPLVSRGRSNTTRQPPVRAQRKSKPQRGSRAIRG